MLGTISLIVLFIIGFLHAPVWLIAQFAFLNAVIGLYTPPDRIAQLKEAGSTPLKFIIGALPLHLVLAAVVFGIGYGIGLLF